MIFEQIMSFFRLLTSQFNKLKKVKQTLENGPKKTVDFAKKQFSALKKELDDLKKKLDKVINTKKIAQRFLDESKQSFENLKNGNFKGLANQALGIARDIPFASEGADIALNNANIAKNAFIGYFDGEYKRVKELYKKPYENQQEVFYNKITL